jgi:hypothetical protein
MRSDLDLAALAALPGLFHRSAGDADVVVTDPSGSDWVDAAVDAVRHSGAKAVYLLSPGIASLGEVRRLERFAVQRRIVAYASPGLMGNRLWSTAREAIRREEPVALEVHSTWVRAETTSRRCCMQQQLAACADIAATSRFTVLARSAKSYAAVFNDRSSCPILISASEAATESHELDAVSPEWRIRLAFGSQRLPAPARLSEIGETEERVTDEYEATTLSSWRNLYSCLVGQEGVAYSLADLERDLNRLDVLESGQVVSSRGL